MSARAWLGRRYKLHGNLAIIDRLTYAEVAREQMSEDRVYDAVWTPIRPIDRQRARRARGKRRS